MVTVRQPYCECEAPVIDVDRDAGCRRCGLPVDFTPAWHNEPWRVAGGCPACARQNELGPWPAHTPGCPDAPLDPELEVPL